MIDSARTGVTNSSVESKTLGRVLGKNSVNDREILAPLIRLGTKVVLSLVGGIDGALLPMQFISPRTMRLLREENLEVSLIV